MLQNLLTDEQLTGLKGLLLNKDNIVVIGHVSPDGDAMGSCLAWADYLTGQGKNVSVVMPNHAPDFLKWLPGAYRIVYGADHPAAVERILDEADLVCCIDFAEAKRVQDMTPLLQAAKAPRLVIDHHLNPDADFATAMLISRPGASSASELVFRVILQLGGYPRLTTKAATCIYCGIMTDTGNFAWGSDDPELYQIVSMLMRKGINKDKIYRHVFYSYSENRLRFMGYTLSERFRMLADGKAAILTMSRPDMERFHYLRGDSEGWVNMPLQIKGCRLSIFLREDTERDVIRVSLRSVDDVPCNKMAAEFFNGGGHLNASGGELPFPMEEAIRTAEQAVEAYKDLL